MKNKTALKGGTYSIVLTTIVLAILVVVNIFAQALPSSATQYDISSTKLYSITSNTKVVVNALEEDVTIYWVVQNGKEDDVMEKLLDKYDTLSDHIKIKKKNPDIYPTFTQKYTSDEVANNSLIVECGDRNRYIAYSDIYVTSGSAYSGYSGTTSFDGEGAITSAIDYVVNSEQPKMYILNGHGEAELSTTFSNQLTKENIETEEFSLLTTNEVPDDADFVLINAPSSDISEEEKNMLEDYFNNGGTNLVKTYLNNVNALNLGTYVTYNTTDEELAKYGLDEPQYNLEVKYTPKSEDSSEDSGDSTDSKAGSSEKTFILHVSAKQDDKAYVRIGDSKIIYEITEDEYKNVTDGSYDSLRHKSVVTADLSDVDSVKVTLEDKDYTIDLSEKKGDVVSTYDGEEIEGTDFTDALKALKASDFTSEEPSEKEEISFTLHYKDDKYPEKEVKIYRYDGTNCLVTIDGKSISLVKRDLVVDLTEAVNAIVLK